MSSDGELVLGWLRTSIAPTGDDGSARALVAWLCDGGADCALLRSMHAMITQELRTRRAHSTTIRIGAALATAMIEHIVAYDLAIELIGLLLASKCAGSALGHIRAACAAAEASNHPPVHVAMICACARALETNAVDTDTRVVAYALDRMLRMAVADTRALRENARASACVVRGLLALVERNALPTDDAARARLCVLLEAGLAPAAIASYAGDARMEMQIAHASDAAPASASAAKRAHPP